MINWEFIYYSIVCMVNVLIVATITMAGAFTWLSICYGVYRLGCKFLERFRSTEK